MDGKALTRLHEGYSETLYKDSEGYLTIGVGHLIDPRKGAKLSKEAIEVQYDIDYAEHEKRLFDSQPWTHMLDAVRRAVLVDMVFNLGSLNGWPRFLSALKLKEYGIAAQEMRNSVWAGQVKTRADRLIDMMLTGKWPQA